MKISRTECCNKMVFANYVKYFCYHCNKAILGYNHFRYGTCDLFIQQIRMDAILHWEERINPRQYVARMQAGMFFEQGQGQGQACPNCGQLNAKVGNSNHIFCWACQIHYCYICRKAVRRVQHISVMKFSILIFFQKRVGRLILMQWKLLQMRILLLWLS